MRQAGEVSARVETTQRGRAAMDFITRQLRSQVCVQAKPVPGGMNDDRAVYSISPTQITFFSDLSDESHRDGNVIKAPELRQIAFENGNLIERRWAGVATGTAATPTYSYSGYPGSPTQTRVLADDISSVDETAAKQPLIFHYFTYNAATPPKPTAELDASAAQTVATLALITKIDMKFRANRSRGKATDRGSTVFQNTVFARIADPNNPTNPSPVCA